MSTELLAGHCSVTFWPQLNPIYVLSCFALKEHSWEQDWYISLALHVYAVKHVWTWPLSCQSLRCGYIERSLPIWRIFRFWDGPWIFRPLTIDILHIKCVPFWWIAPNLVAALSISSSEFCAPNRELSNHAQWETLSKLMVTIHWK